MAAKATETSEVSMQCLRASRQHQAMRDITTIQSLIDAAAVPGDVIGVMLKICKISCLFMEQSFLNAQGLLRNSENTTHRSSLLGRHR
jgi:hypothetical protein